MGYYIGSKTGTKIPVIDGFVSSKNVTGNERIRNNPTEDQLKALGAAAASSGAVALFHMVGVTPEAPTLDDACHAQLPEPTVRVSMADLQQARQALSTVPDGPIKVIALGSPHFSIDEFAQIMPLLTACPPKATVEFIICTNRFVLEQLKVQGWDIRLSELGVRLVVDTCVVVTPIIRAMQGTVMTNSGKFAHYTPSNTGHDVIFGSLQECVQSAAIGRVWRDEDLWR